MSVRTRRREFEIHTKKFSLVLFRAGSEQDSSSLTHRSASEIAGPKKAIGEMVWRRFASQFVCSRTICHCGNCYFLMLFPFLTFLVMWHLLLFGDLTCVTNFGNVTSLSLSAFWRSDSYSIFWRYDKYIIFFWRYVMCPYLAICHLYRPIYFLVMCHRPNETFGQKFCKRMQWMNAKEEQVFDTLKTSDNPPNI